MRDQNAKKHPISGQKQANACWTSSERTQIWKQTTDPPRQQPQQIH